MTGRGCGPRPGRSPAGRWRDERGQAGGIEVLPFGVLIFVGGALLILNLWSVVESKAATEAAAREAVRAVVEAPDLAPDRLQQTAQGQVAAVLAGRGLNEERAGVRLVASRLSRCAPVEVEVTYPVPYVDLPFLGAFGATFTVTGRHTELIDPYRAGLATDGGDPCD